MRYYKTIIDEYLVSVGIGAGGTEITESEYCNLLDAIHTRPADAPERCDYRLKTDLTWELYELPEIPEEDEDATLDDALGALAELGVE